MASATKSVLITGCSSGIGEATALRLAKAGWRVIATARNPETLSALAEAGCGVLALDVTDEASMQSAVAAAGDLDALVNNAGYSLSGALETLGMEAVRRQFETNVFGLLRMCQLVLPGMRARGAGRIVNISSMGGKLTFPGGGAYHATKYAVEAMSDAMRYEVAGFGVDVVLVEPGLIRTEFAKAAGAAMAAGTVAGNSGDAGAAETGPYGDFNAAVAQATKDAYEKGPLAMLGGPPDRVAKVIQRALKTRRPKPRYTVTASASLLLLQRALMSDRQWDGFLRQNFPQPGKG